MLILLPPSEGKTAPTSGPALDLHALWAPQLEEYRAAVINDLVAVSASNPQSLGAPRGALAQVHANVNIWTAPTAPATSVYTGVLYAALGFETLVSGAAALAQESIRIASPVYGFVSPEDPIATYRLPMTAKLPTVGAPLTYLAPAVSAVLDAEDPPLVLDCRSGPYIRLWRPKVPWIHVRAIEIREGKPTVVSHFAKHHRGVLTQHLLTRTSALPTSTGGVLEAARELLGTQYREVTLEEGPPGTHVLELTLV